MAELTDYTGYLLRTAFLRAAGLVPKTFPKGSHPRDASVLSTLEAVGPCSQQQLVDALHVNRSVMVKLIDRLEARGLVERRRDPIDTRRVTLGLTRRGRALDVPHADSVEAVADALLAATPARDIAATTRVLDRFAELLLTDEPEA